MARGRARQILFRIFYSTSFTTVFLVTVGFACAGPIDALYQSYRRNRLIDMFLIAGIYFVTGLLAVFLYASRLYTNRSLLKDIPKTFMPIDKAELPGKKVWRLVEDCKNRSAVIAYLAKPRSKRVEFEVNYARARIYTLLKPEHSKQYRMFEPHWGTISHPGWSGPAVTETPNLEYRSVVNELTDLIEARAVSLAPVSPNTGRNEDGTANPAEHVIEALRRPEESGMRQYVSQLIAMNVLQDNSLIIAFLTLYERARFAPEPLSEAEFKSLMRMFAEILRTMKPVDLAMIEPLAEYQDDDKDDDAVLTERENNNTKPHISRTLTGMTSTSSLASSLAGSVRHYQNARSTATPIRATSYATAMPRFSSESIRSDASNDLYADAQSNSPEGDNWKSPTTRPPFFRARSSNSNTASRSRTRHVSSGRPSRLKRAMSRRSMESNMTGRNSLRSLRSAKSNGSVIRLNPNYGKDGTADLPYEYTRRTTEPNEVGPRPAG